MKKILILLAIALILIALANLTIFEDGSFYFFHLPTLGGCLPNNLCS
jgi:hypothetical protein